VADLDDDAAVANLPDVDLAEPAGQVVEEQAAWLIIRRTAEDVRHEIFRLRQPIPDGEGLREAGTVRLELDPTRFVDLIASLAVPEVLAHPQIDVMRISVSRERPPEKVVEHRKPMIHGTDLTPAGHLVELRELEPSTSAAGAVTAGGAATDGDRRRPAQAPCRRQMRAPDLGPDAGGNRLPAAI
jgi:hypothetical protein